MTVGVFDEVHIIRDNSADPVVVVMDFDPDGNFRISITGDNKSAHLFLNGIMHASISMSDATLAVGQTITFEAGQIIRLDGGERVEAHADHMFRVDGGGSGFSFGAVEWTWYYPFKGRGYLPSPPEHPDFGGEVWNLDGGIDELLIDEYYARNPHIPRP